jgi:RNA polymerase sigma factor (sigma-70 family)
VSILPTEKRRDQSGGHERPPDAGRAAAEAAVAALYATHALGLTRLAQVMLGDRTAAEDVVQEAFAGLFRRWAFLNDTAKAPHYLRSAVLNGCRNVLRSAVRPVPLAPASAEGADVALLAAEERQAVLAALRTLPDRQREALVLLLRDRLHPAVTERSRVRRGGGLQDRGRGSDGPAAARVQDVRDVRGRLVR